MKPLWNLFLLLLLIFLGLHPQHMGVPRLGIESELQQPAYTTATATGDPSCICDLHHRSWQCWILNLLSKARDWTFVLMDASQIRFHWATIGTPYFGILKTWGGLCIPIKTYISFYLCNLETYFKCTSLLFSFLAISWHKEFLGRGSDPSCSCNLCYSCSTIKSF